MIIYPAIDLLNGECVRLSKGDFDTAKVYSNSPFEVAERFKAQGAKYLHIVDLDGAKAKKPQQTAVIQALCAQSGLFIQSGGGVRSRNDCLDLLNAGVQSIVIGSLAVTNPKLVANILETLGSENFTIALDINFKENIPTIATNGWLDSSGISIDQLFRNYKSGLIKTVLCTDIAQDGMLEGLNRKLYLKVKKDFPDINWIASGGVKDLDDIRFCRDINLYGVVVGKAIYERRFLLTEALGC